MLLFFVFRFLCVCSLWFAVLAAVASRMYLTMGLGDFNYMDHPVSLPAKHLLRSEKILQRWPESGEDQLGTRPKSKVTFHRWGGCTAFLWECCRCCKCFFDFSVCVNGLLRMVQTVDRNCILNQKHGERFASVEVAMQRLWSHSTPTWRCESFPPSFSSRTIRRAEDAKRRVADFTGKCW